MINKLLFVNGYSALELITFRKYKPVHLLWIGIFAVILHIVLQLYPLSALFVLQITNVVVAFTCTLVLGGIVFLLSRKPTKAQCFFVFILSIYLAWGITCLIPALLGYKHVVKKAVENPFLRILDGLMAMSIMLYSIEILRPNYLKIRTILKILTLLLIIPFLGIISNNLKSDGQEFMAKIIFIARLLLVIGYPLVTLSYLVKYQKAYKQWYKQNYANLEKLEESWLKYYMVAYFVIITSYVYAMFNLSIEALLVHHIIFLLFFVLIFPFVLRQQELVEYPDEKEMQFMEACDDLNEKNAEERQTYSNLRLMYKEKLIHWMVQDKPYLKSDFHLIDIMNILPLNRKYISRLINEEIGETFFSFVMKYRIEESVRLLENRTDLTIAKIAIKSGFSSPSVFGRAFLKEKGISPLEYHKQYMITNN